MRFTLVLEGATVDCKEISCFIYILCPDRTSWEGEKIHLVEHCLMMVVHNVSYTSELAF